MQKKPLSEYTSARDYDPSFALNRPSNFSPDNCECSPPPTLKNWRCPRTYLFLGFVLPRSDIKFELPGMHALIIWHMPLFFNSLLNASFVAPVLKRNCVRNFLQFSWEMERSRTSINPSFHLLDEINYPKHTYIWHFILIPHFSVNPQFLNHPSQIQRLKTVLEFCQHPRFYWIIPYVSTYYQKPLIPKIRRASEGRWTSLAGKQGPGKTL